MQAKTLKTLSKKKGITKDEMKIYQLFFSKNELLREPELLDKKYSSEELKLLGNIEFSRNSRKVQDYYVNKLINKLNLFEYTKIVCETLLSESTVKFKSDTEFFGRLISSKIIEFIENDQTLSQNAKDAFVYFALEYPIVHKVYFQIKDEIDLAFIRNNKSLNEDLFISLIGFFISRCKANENKAKEIYKLLSELVCENLCRPEDFVLSEHKITPYLKSGISPAKSFNYHKAKIFQLTKGYTYENISA